MPKKRFSAEQINRSPAPIEMLTSRGKTPAVACREAGVLQQSYYRWQKLEVDQARRTKDLERESVRLKRLVADLSLEKQILKDVPRETCKP